MAPSIVAGKVQSEYGLSPFEVGLIFLAYNFPYAVFQVPFGALSRRLGRRRLMVMGFFVNGLTFAGGSFSRGVISLAVALFIAGIGGSTYHSLGIPMISDQFPARRGETLGYHQTGGSIGSFLAPVAIGAISETLGWRSAFLILSFLGVALAPVLWYRLRDSSVTIVEDSRPSFRELRGPLLLILGSSIYVIAFRGLQLFGIIYFEQGKGLGLQAYVLFSLSQVAGIFSGPIFGRLSDKTDRKRVIVYLVLVEVASAFLLVLLNGIPLYLIVIVLGFAFYGLLATMDAYLGDVTRPHFYGTVVGINLAASFVVSSILSPVLGSSISAYGYDLSFALLATFSILGFPLILLARRPRERL